ncbi:DMT family transporter [Solicola sp. PLA-1-18]|uniref:DMT family transporter n=1 Tax=Solicola sp. PLA-1-18 TaxID=3380532 RepID=UPI003B75DBAE
MASARTDVVSSTVFVLCWSSGFVGARLGTAVASPVTVLGWRFACLGLVLLAVCLVLRVRFAARTVRQQALLGTLQQVCYLGLVFWAISLGVPAGLAALVTSMQPLLVSTVAGPLLGERVTRWQRVGLVVGLAGVALVVGGDLGGSSAPWWAYLLPVAAMLTMAVGTVTERRWRTSESLLQVVTVQSVVAALVFGVVGALTGHAAPPPDVQFWVAVAWLVGLSSIGGYGAFVFVSRRQGATRASTLLYLTPPTVMVWTFLMFGDTVTALGLTGLVVCAAGVTLALRSRGGPQPVG